MRTALTFVAASVAALAMSIAVAVSAQADRPSTERFTIDVPAAVLRPHGVLGHGHGALVRRMYCDFVREPLLSGRIERPVGMLMSAKDLFPPAPRELGERLFNVQHWVETDVGGHFLEWEEPELVARDMQKFFGRLER
jgi:pimeloyl-ACP methyl ester carboxylesterase